MKMFRRLSYWLRHRSVEADLSEEIAFHEAMKQRELETSGIAAASASHVRSRAMGNVTRAREDARAVWIWPWFESVWQDLYYGARMLRKHPSFTLIATIALSAAIGLNTSLITVVNALIFRPWDVADSRRMITLESLDCCKREGGQPHGFSLDEVAYFAKRARTIKGIYSFRHDGEGGKVALGTGERRLESAWVSWEYFRVLGVSMHLGRSFRADEDQNRVPSAEVVISYGVWQRQFGGHVSVVGSTIRLDGQSFTVVGVTPKTFTGTFGTPVELWIPLSAVPLIRPEDNWVKNVLRQPAACCTSAAARLAEGAVYSQAQVELSALSRSFRALSGAPFKGIFVGNFTPLAGPPGSRNDVIHLFALLSAGASAVLLLACANVGNLLLARMATRQREIAVRLSLGASRFRIVRQLLTEGLTLAALGALGGLTIAIWLPDIIVRIAMGRDKIVGLRPDATVLGYTLGLTVLTCLIFGLPPALQATRPARTAGVRMPLRSVFLSVQIALCVVLLVAAGLLLRGVDSVVGENHGFAVQQVTAVSFEFPTRALAAARTKPFVTQLSAMLPDVVGSGAVGLSSGVPLKSSAKSDVRLSGESEDRSQDILMEDVSAGYFDVLRIPRVAGRGFERDDEGREVILTNETLANLYGGSRSFVGSTVLVGGAPRRVVGVVKDFRASSLERVEPTVYQPFSGQVATNVLVQNQVPGAARAVSALARRIEPSIVVTIAPLSDYLDQRLGPPRILAQVSGALGILALLLATIGVFGVFAFSVQQRTQEIGVRMALGAQAQDVVRLVLRSCGRSIAIGLLIGFAIAFAASRMLRAYLFGLSPLDPITYVCVALILVAAGMAAAYWPARRATRISPAAALRVE
jgi:predicted permease